MKYNNAAIPASRMSHNIQWPVTPGIFSTNALATQQKLRPTAADLHAKYSSVARLPDPQPCVLEHETAFNVACALGHVDIVRALDNAGAQRNVVSSNGLSALHAAAANGHTAVVEYLLSKPDVDKELQTTHDLNTALHLACASGCETVKVHAALACVS